MTLTIHNTRTVEQVDPADPTILVRLNPAGLSDDCLTAIRTICEPTGYESDVLRSWLAEVALRESGRRIANTEADESDGTTREVDAWLLPWHKWTEAELSAALACSFSWCVIRIGRDLNQVLEAVHCAVCTACCTRLGEFHTAIEESRAGR